MSPVHTEESLFQSLACLVFDSTRITLFRVFNCWLKEHVYVSGFIRVTFSRPCLLNGIVLHSCMYVCIYIYVYVLGNLLKVVVAKQP